MPAENERLVVPGFAGGHFGNDDVADVDGVPAAVHERAGYQGEVYFLTACVGGFHQRRHDVVGVGRAANLELEIGREGGCRD